jgi:hypothetical protein
MRSGNDLAFDDQNRADRGLAQGSGLFGLYQG